MNKTPFHQLLAFVIMVSLSYTAYAEPIKIKFPHVSHENSAKGQMATYFQSLIKERIGDEKMIIEVYPSSQLYNDQNAVQALIDNEVQLIAPATSKLKPYTSRLQVLDLPFLFVNDRAAKSFLDGDYGQRMLRLLNSKGLTGLGYLHGGMKQLSASTPIKAPNDLNGLRFRIMSSDIIESQFTALQAAPSRAAYSEVYSLLETKQIDGQENTWSNIYSQKFYEHQPYIIESNHGYIGYMLLSNTQFLDNLPEDIKPIVQQSLADALEYGNKIADEQTLLDREKIIASEIDIYTLSVEERAIWVDAVKPVWREFENVIGSELINIAAAAR